MKCWYEGNGRVNFIPDDADRAMIFACFTESLKIEWARWLTNRNATYSSQRAKMIQEKAQKKAHW